MTRVCAAVRLWELPAAVWERDLLSSHHPGLDATDPGTRQLHLRLTQKSLYVLWRHAWHLAEPWSLPVAIAAGPLLWHSGLARAKESFAGPSTLIACIVLAQQASLHRVVHVLSPEP